jgi:hypothetical protein
MTNACDRQDRADVEDDRLLKVGLGSQPATIGQSSKIPVPSTIPSTWTSVSGSGFWLGFGLGFAWIGSPSPHCIGMWGQPPFTLPIVVAAVPSAQHSRARQQCGALCAKSSPRITITSAALPRRSDHRSTDP